MKGSDVMIIGSLLLLPIVLLVPREYLLYVAIPFLLIELIIALYVIHLNKKKLGDSNNNKN